MAAVTAARGKYTFFRTLAN